jgi:hypothetical protein
LPPGAPDARPARWPIGRDRAHPGDNPPMTAPGVPPPLPRLDPEPDHRSVRWIWRIWAAVLLAVLLAAAGGLPAVLLVQLAPLGALLILWPAWRAGGWLWHALRVQAYGPWQGSMVAFRDQRLRVIEGENCRLNFVADDVFDLFDLTGRARDPAHVTVIAGTDGLVRPPGADLLCFTERGLEAWLAGRTGQRAVAFRHFLKVQVLEPHARRLERDGPARTVGDPPHR